ncbi:MAG: ABC transporter permease [Elusimicrobia bacterium]|nr:ABC transporter permease [Elusimicrobiota bacterium]
MIEFAPRPEPSAADRALVTLGALCSGLALAALAFLLMGAHPGRAMAAVFSGSFMSAYGLGETATKAIPLILSGIGLSLAFRGRLWNIGAEGQLLAGATAATGLALALQDSLPAPLAVPLLFAAGAAGGAALAALAGWLKTRFRVNEVVSTLMLNYICAELVQHLVYGPWKGPSQSGFPYTDNFAAPLVLPVLGATRIHWPTLVLALASAAAAWVLVHRTRFGFELRAMGGNPDAAACAGMNASRTTLLVMAASGGLAGLAGVGEVAGIHRHLTYPWAVSSGYGYAAIIVAWVAGLDPLLAVPAGLFLGGIMVGGDAIQISMGLPAAAISLFNGLLLLCLMAGEFFLRYRPRRRARTSDLSPVPGGAGKPEGKTA